MKKSLKILVFILIALLLCGSLVACTEEEEPVQNGIVIVKKEKSIIKEKGLNTTLEDLFNGAVQEKTGRDLKTARNRIEKVCVKAERTIRDNNVGNEVYVAILEELQRDQDVKISALVKLIDGEITQEMKDLTLFLINQLGKNVFSQTVYNCFACYLETVYKEYKDNDYKESTVKRAKEDWEDFLTIGQEDFTSMLSIAILAVDLSSADEEKLEEESKKFTFNDGEIAAIARSLDLSSGIPVTGWKVMLRLVGSLMSDSSFWGMVYNKANIFLADDKGDDFEIVATSLFTFMPLITSVQKNIKAEWISAIQEGGDEAYRIVLESFREEDWERLKDVLEIKLSGNYWDVGINYFGYDSDFITYSASVVTYTVEDLKNCINEQEGLTVKDLSKVMEGIVANISPLFSYYGWQYDRG